jgi:hypothetical protein
MKQTSPLRLRPGASSSRRTAIRVNRDHYKTSPHSDHCAPARKPIHATSSILPLPALSSIQNGSSSAIRQDAVYIALTQVYRLSAANRVYLQVRYSATTWILNAGHVPILPTDRLLAQDGDVGWFDFWLNGVEDPNPMKRAQYLRWEELKRKQDQNAPKSRETP